MEMKHQHLLKGGKFLDPKHESKPKILRQEDRVIVRVWHSKVESKKTNLANAVVNEVLKAEACVGHVSLETANRYASIWPATPVRNPLLRYPSNYDTSLKWDVEGEGGPCDVKVYLYSLNREEIEKSFDQIQLEAGAYILAGDNVSAQSGGHSCVSLVLELLKRGGIEKLDPPQESLMYIDIETPNDFATYIQNAKLRELAMFPDTKDFIEEYGQKEEHSSHSDRKCILL